MTAGFGFGIVAVVQYGPAAGEPVETVFTEQFQRCLPDASLRGPQPRWFAAENSLEGCQPLLQVPAGTLLAAGILRIYRQWNAWHGLPGRAHVQQQRHDRVGVGTHA